MTQLEFGKTLRWLVQLDPQEQLDRQVQLEIQDLQEQLEILDLKETLVQWAIQVLKVMRDQLDHKETKDLQVHKVKQV
jgi:hypothetical protein